MANRTLPGIAPADVIAEMKEANMLPNTIRIVRELIDSCLWAALLLKKNDYKQSADFIKAIAELAQGDDELP